MKKKCSFTWCVCFLPFCDKQNKNKILSQKNVFFQSKRRPHFHISTGLKAIVKKSKLRRVYTSRLLMHFPHCIVFFSNYLGRLKSRKVLENAIQCDKWMRKQDVATQLNLTLLSEIDHRNSSPAVSLLTLVHIFKGRVTFGLKVFNSFNHPNL